MHEKLGREEKEFEGFGVGRKYLQGSSVPSGSYSCFIAFIAFISFTITYTVYSYSLRSITPSTHEHDVQLPSSPDTWADRVDFLHYSSGLFEDVSFVLLPAFTQGNIEKMMRSCLYAQCPLLALGMHTHLFVFVLFLCMIWRILRKKNDFDKI